MVISIGHTAADYGCAAEAMKEGALHVTHLYNAMNPMGHRDPGVIGAAADNQDCMVELIGDGIHIHPVTVRNTFRLFGDSRVVLISDSMMATGMENGLCSWFKYGKWYGASDPYRDQYSGIEWKIFYISCKEWRSRKERPASGFL